MKKNWKEKTKRGVVYQYDMDPPLVEGKPKQLHAIRRWISAILQEISKFIFPRSCKTDNCCYIQWRNQ